MKRKIILALMFMIFVLPCVSYADEVEDLLNFYVKKFTPEKATLIISDKPDETGLFNDVYLDLQGVVIEKLRLSSLVVNMRGVQFNEPSEWSKGNVECLDAISVLATATLLEKDINESIENRTFGSGDGEWHDMSMKILPSGLSGKGYYKYSFLDILIEINSKLKIVKGKELWLDNPAVKVNKLDLPDYVTRKALSAIQPLVDLREFPLPLTLNKVELKKGSATLSSRTLPKALKGGLKYTYSK
ncbi:MAG: DUF2993 domain-containing protein [Synergistales bacterium]|nr:DUF2993 domain-containing protein [Synergistales bacterium]MDY6401991.1 DUF2993 domain-containing protein [Synergistales bacterium]MDY6405162.1 DUF2993 domain-containing protein [Synergistales bacterium]MDY6409703.1 DUF2993 domain-containing protein [Synergistales bacterium]MDY6414065.1 DUF2993 domain-containing protein [Synergistales bacterium]